MICDADGQARLQPGITQGTQARKDGHPAAPVQVMAVPPAFELLPGLVLAPVFRRADGKPFQRAGGTEGVTALAQAAGHAVQIMAQRRAAARTADDDPLRHGHQAPLPCGLKGLFHPVGDVAQGQGRLQGHAVGIRIIGGQLLPPRFVQMAVMLAQKGGRIRGAGQLVTQGAQKGALLVHKNMEGGAQLHAHFQQVDGFTGQILHEQGIVAQGRGIALEQMGHDLAHLEADLVVSHHSSGS